MGKNYLERSISNFNESIIPSDELFHILGKRWSLSVIQELVKNDSMGFNQIKNHFQKITPTTLSSVMKTLEQYGIISKKHNTNPLSSVSYSLTNYGILLHDFSIMIETLSSASNSTPSMNEEYFRKISTIIKNFTRNNSEIIKNEIRKYVLPLGTLASVSTGLCISHGIQHLEHLTSFS